ncbi:protein phosphatase 2C domain protein (plasmid) [Gemmatirosa kalamazoonensis]|uniref:Protein phosphatase 2C domain protein n=1 Tax=Gemmatirosa kalamazoonensis TaxID=861299 RepID=W0RVW6_9BACT|nr:protein phosphatase 2C domain-containing protein [Gemmatirosa kalamazoonensis]AHG93693.1 protein phosphatase 2C domain protein [Gemmatirosa kalamazoonensis]
MGKFSDYWKHVAGAPAATPAPFAVRLSPGDVEATSPPALRSDDVRRRVESYGLSHVGAVRPGNEDHFIIASLQRSLEVRQTNLEDRGLLEPLCGPKAYLFAVADGVGGQEGGRLASGITLRTIVEYLSETVGSYHAVPAGREQAFLDPLRQAVQRAHERLLGTFGASQGGPATTLTIALLVWPQVFLVHIGDSRAYHFRAGALRRLTRDQTMGAYLVDQAAMSEQQAEQAGYNDVLSSAVGAPDMTPVVSAVTLERGDLLLLCTDGLTKHISEDRIAAVLARGTNAEVDCRELIELALADGARDNVTVVVSRALPA